MVKSLSAGGSDLQKHLHPAADCFAPKLPASELLGLCQNDPEKIYPP